MTACGGSELQGDPVALPIPFSGTLTADTNILIAEGAPIASPSTLTTAAFLKNQTADLPISWELFDSMSSDLCGTVTFNSMTNPVVSEAGQRREYFLDACVDGSGVEFQACSSMQCFEHATDYTPTSETVDLAASIPGATAGVKKLVCSGNVNRGKGNFVEGQLLNGNFVIDTVLLPDGKTNFNTNRESSVTIDGSSFCEANERQGKVLLTLLVQSFGAYLPGDVIPDAPPILNQLLFPVFSPGSEEIIGTEIHHVHSVTESECKFDIFATSTIQLNDGSFVRIREDHGTLDCIPELDSVLDRVVTDKFLEDPNFDDSIFSANGGRAFHQTAIARKEINCDEPSDATGIFREFCDEFGPYIAEHRSLVMHNPETGSILPIMLVFTFSKP